MNRRNDRLKNMPIKKKLVISHGSIIVTTFLLIVILLSAMKTIEGKLVQLYEGPTTNILYSADLYYTQIDIQRAVNRVMAEGVEHLDETYPEMEAAINENLAIVDNAYQILKDNLITEEDRASLEAIQEKLDKEATPYRTEVLKLLKEGDFEAAHEYNNTYYRPLIDEIKEMIDALEASINDTAQGYCDAAATTAIICIIVGIVLLILVTVAAIVIANKVTRIITQPVEELTEASKLMRTGDMSAAKLITYESRDELGILADSMRDTMNNLDAYVKEISGTLVEIAKGDFTKDFNKITDFLGDFSSIKESFVFILREFNLNYS